MRLYSTVLLLCFFMRSGLAQNETRWRDLCDRAKSTQLPLSPSAGPLSPAEIAACDERALYYGIGGKPNYAAALQCGWHPYAHPQNTVGNMFYGVGVLSMLYANGFGVQRNVNAAIRFACENEWAAPAEFAYRIPRLETLRGRPTRFDLCDDITSGLSHSACTAIQTRKRSAAREQRIGRIEKSLSRDARAAFVILRAVEEEFELARTRNEIDLSGTSRVAFALAEGDALQADFIDTLERLASNAIPRAAPATVARLRQAVAYVFERGQTTDPAMWEAFGTVKREGVSETQERWNTLIEAWADFVRTAYRRVPEPSIHAHLLRARLKQLLTLDPNDR